MALEPPTPATAPHLLQCGRSIEDLLDELDAMAPAPSAHSPDCPHCATARAGVDALHQATRHMLGDPSEPPPGLLDRIMASIRVELGTGATVPLPTGHGPADISVRALATLLRYAADTVPGARARHCQVRADPRRPGEVAVELSLSIRYGEVVAPLVEQVRVQVATALDATVGLHTGTIAIDVVDLW